MTVWVRFAWISVAWWALLATAMGMKLEIRLDSIAPRSSAPIPVTVILKGDRPLTEGCLHILLKSGGTVLIDHTTETLVVTAEERERRLLLPPAWENTLGGQAEWILTFETDDERFEARNSYVTIPSSRERVAIVAVVHQDLTKPPVALRDLLNEGRLETLMGYDRESVFEKKANRGGLLSAKARTWQAPLTPARLPSQALWLCGYDMVALSPAVLTSLSESQTEALTTWVRAGGSILVTRMPDHRVPESSRMGKWLQALEEKAQVCTIWSPATGQDLGVQLVARQWDLGRVVVIDGLSVATETEDARWRQVFRFLWNLRDIEVVDKRAKEFNGFPSNSHRVVWRGGSRVIEKERSKEPLVTSTGSADRLTQQLRHRLKRDLMPENVKLLPVSQLAWMVLVFLLIVGPLEATLLKRLKRRWLTWVTFPVTIIGMTLGAFFVGERLLGEDSLKTFSVVDLSADGRSAVRRSQVSLTFSRSTRPVSESQQQALVSPVSLVENRYQPDESQPTFEGRYPIDYQFQRQAERWTPYMQQQMDFAQGVTVPKALEGIDWESFRPSNFSAWLDAEQALSDRLKTVEGGTPIVRLVSTPRVQARGNDRYSWARDDANFQRHFLVASDWRRDGMPKRHPDGVRIGGSYGDEVDGTGLAMPFPRLTSPHGGALLQDWIVPDHEQWLILFGEGSDRTVFRYIYPEYSS